MNARPALVLDNEEEPEAPKVREVVATAVGLTIGLADDRQMQLQTGFADDEPDHVINARLDRAMRFADRQKAKYEIVSLRKELKELNLQLLQGEDAMAVVELNFKRAQAQLDVEILEHNRHKAGVETEAYNTASRTGRSQKAALNGRPASDIARYDLAIKSAQEAQAKNAAERDQAIEGFAASKDRRQTRVAEIEGLIAEKEVLLKG